MFFEKSQPLHRTLVSALAKARNHQSLIGASFKALCEEYGGNCNKGKRFSVSRAALSIMGMPKFPSKFNDLSEGIVMRSVLEIVLNILRATFFSRDCFVAACLSFCAALQVGLSPKELGLFIIRGIFNQSTSICSGSTESEYVDAISKLPYGGDLLHDILNLSVLSRLCLIRGILTAVSRTVLNMPFAVEIEELDTSDGVVVVSKKAIKTVLYDGILPELCNYCENPTDSHFNFHALTVMQICLQQIKTSMLGDPSIVSDDYYPMGEEMGTRLLRIIWNNLEDPLSQTVKQVHLIFDLFLDIQSTLNWGECGDKIKSFLGKIALDVLHLG